MGADLTFIPVDGDDSFAIGHTLLDCRPSEGVATLLRIAEEYKSVQAPKRFWSYVSREADGKEVDTHYGQVTATPYGEPLHMIRNALLLAVLEAADLSDESNDLLAAVAYLRALPPKQFTALYWH